MLAPQLAQQQMNKHATNWCLALAIIGTLQLVACLFICCCASCGASILGPAVYEKYVESHSKHVMGGHLHEMVHKHKPGGTHPILEGHLLLVGGAGGSSEKTPLNKNLPNQ